MYKDRINFDYIPNMARDDFYWLIGLLEGEGSFMKGKPSHPNQPSVNISMTDKCIVEKFNKLFDINYIHRREYEDNVRKDCFQAQVVGKKAVEFMQKSKEHYSQRRQDQIRKALDFYDPDTKSSYGRSLTDVEAKKVKDLLKTSDYTHAETAEKFSAKVYVIHDIARGETYQDI